MTTMCVWIRAPRERHGADQHAQMASAGRASTKRRSIQRIPAWLTPTRTASSSVRLPSSTRFGSARMTLRQSNSPEAAGELARRTLSELRSDSKEPLSER